MGYKSLSPVGISFCLNLLYLILSYVSLNSFFYSFAGTLLSLVRLLKLGTWRVFIVISVNIAITHKKLSIYIKE